MTVGVSASAANTMLNAIGDVYAQMHTGDPGAAGTSNIAIFAVRAFCDLAAASAAARVLVSPVAWGTPWAGVDQTITHLSTWTAATGGLFMFSTSLATNVTFIAGAVPRLNVLSITIPSIAAN